MKPLPKMIVLCAAGLLSVASLATARQPKDKPKKGNAPQKSTETKDQPKVVVVAEVQVNISTWINLGAASGAPQSPPERKPESVKGPSVSDLRQAVEKASEKASEGGSRVVVLTNLKVDISTWLNIGPSSNAPSNAPVDAPSGIKPKQKTSKEKKPLLTGSGDGGQSGSLDKEAEDLFELHVRVRRTAVGMDVLLAGTTPSAQVAAAAAERIKQVRDQGMVGLVILPLILKTNPNTSLAVQTAWGSIKADASGSRLTLSASIPKEAVAAAADAVDAAVGFVKGLVGQK